MGITTVRLIEGIWGPLNTGLTVVNVCKETTRAYF